MSYDNDQNEYPIPTNNDSNNKRSSASLLPRYFRTDTNKKFLGATLDQLTTPGVAEKINGYVGTRVAKAAKITDSYLSDVSADRENYQFEPFAVVKDNLGNVTFDADYLDYIGQLTNFGANTENHSTLSEQEFDAWDPHIDFDKFTNFNTEFSASAVNNSKTYQILAVKTAELDTGGTAGTSNADLNGVRAFNISGSGITNIVPEFTRLATPTGDFAHKSVLFLVETDATPVLFVTDTVDSIEAVYHKAPPSNDRGDFEDTEGGDLTDSSILDIPEINLELRSEAIVAKTRKLKAVWSPEFAQDLNAYHSIDAEAELTSMLSEYVSQEIDLEILDMLISNAQTVERWSARVGFEFDGSTNAFTQGNATAQAYNQGTWFQTLGTKIQKVSNKIHQLTLRGGANFLVCSPTVATILESIPGYAADTDGDQMQFAMGVQKVGSINSRFQVYKNPYMTENTILMGYRGAQFLETGAVYAPYIPLIMTPLVYDPSNFTPRKGVMTRYAKKMVRPEFYGKVFVEGLDRI